MSALQKVIGTGGACKVTPLFCMYCECNGDKNMFYYREGDARCKFCKHNNRDRCPHRRINSDKEVFNKGRRLLNRILLDQQRIRGNAQLSLVDLFGEGELDCFEGYNEDGSKKMIKVDVRATIKDNGQTLELAFVNNYCRHVQHSEEWTNVVNNSMMVYNPKAEDCKQDTRNLCFDYKNCADEETVDEFFVHIRYVYVCMVS